MFKPVDAQVLKGAGAKELVKTLVQLVLVEARLPCQLQQGRGGLQVPDQHVPCGPDTFYVIRQQGAGIGIAVF